MMIKLRFTQHTTGTTMNLNTNTKQTTHIERNINKNKTKQIKLNNKTNYFVSILSHVQIKKNKICILKINQNHPKTDTSQSQTHKKSK